MSKPGPFGRRSRPPDPLARARRSRSRRISAATRSRSASSIAANDFARSTSTALATRRSVDSSPASTSSLSSAPRHDDAARVTTSSPCVVAGLGQPGLGDLLRQVQLEGELGLARLAEPPVPLVERLVEGLDVGAGSRRATTRPAQYSDARSVEPERRHPADEREDPAGADRAGPARRRSRPKATSGGTGSGIAEQLADPACATSSWSSWSFTTAPSVSAADRARPAARRPGTRARSPSRSSRPRRGTSPGPSRAAARPPRPRRARAPRPRAARAPATIATSRSRSGWSIQW